MFIITTGANVLYTKTFFSSLDEINDFLKNDLSKIYPQHNISINLDKVREWDTWIVTAYVDIPGANMGIKFDYIVFKLKENK